MTKRKLSKQQSTRISQRQQKAQVQILNGTPGGPTDSAQAEGLVLARFSAKVDVETESGQVIRCHLRANLGEVVAGDKVIWQEQEASGVVLSVLPRTTQLQRPDSYGKLKPVAANVSRCVITVAPEPQAHANLIDRYLVVAETLGLEPILLVNKADLLSETHELHNLLASYEALGYTTCLVSCHAEQGLEPLQTLLKDGISIFVGQSGVGKSSVIQALLPQEEIKIGDLSEQVRKGRHTTTHARLYHFPTGGDCIDSPGIREFGLWHLTPQQVVAGFKELEPLAGQCRFRNCSHRHEPGCAILQALADGRISRARFDSYRQIVDTLTAVTMHS